MSKCFGLFLLHMGVCFEMTFPVYFVFPQRQLSVNGKLRQKAERMLALTHKQLSKPNVIECLWPGNKTKSQNKKKANPTVVTD